VRWRVRRREVRGDGQLGGEDVFARRGRRGGRVCEEDDI
jgi:hypothetical protein